MTRPTPDQSPRQSLIWTGLLTRSRADILAAPGPLNQDNIDIARVMGGKALPHLRLDRRGPQYRWLKRFFDGAPQFESTIRPSALLQRLTDAFRA